MPRRLEMGRVMCREAGVAKGSACASGRRSICTVVDRGNTAGWGPGDKGAAGQTRGTDCSIGKQWGGGLKCCTLMHMFDSGIPIEWRAVGVGRKVDSSRAF